MTLSSPEEMADGSISTTTWVARTDNVQGSLGIWQGQAFAAATG